ncbi:MAG: DUF4351 domain-containing protein [Acidobacteria bacterium]|nr:DUF4351 domain-containing protein [Acidobacteriota bacterium]
MIDHDQLFKELIKTFFVEFIELFFGAMRAYFDEASIEFLDKQYFTDLVEGERRESDIIAKARFCNEEAFFIIALENQGDVENLKKFQQRVFFYFSYFHQSTRLPVYPIVVFYGSKPKQAVSGTYVVAFPDWKVLEFNYRVVQLNRMNWRDFVRRKNPVAVALMAKMNFKPEERPFVQMQILRLLTTLKLDAARMHLIAGFVHTYLKLNAEEQKIFQREVAKLEPRRRKKIMELTTSWKEEGIQIGIQKGLKEGLKEGIQKGMVLGEQRGVEKGLKQATLTTTLRLLNHRLKPISPRLQKRIEKLSLAQLEELSVALLDFSSIKDLTAWLNRTP